MTVLWQNRKVCVLCNLKPANMRGIKSEAMVLAASNSDHTTVSSSVTFNSICILCALLNPLITVMLMINHSLSDQTKESTNMDLDDT